MNAAMALRPFDLGEQVANVLGLYSAVTKTLLPLHDDDTPALWVRLDNGTVVHRRSKNAPHQGAVVASWHAGSKRQVSFEDFLAAVVMELEEIAATVPPSRLLPSES